MRQLAARVNVHAFRAVYPRIFRAGIICLARSPRTNATEVNSNDNERVDIEENQMHPVLRAELEAKQGTIIALCERYDVALLELFGSGTTDEWTPTNSDLDFVVSFAPHEGPGLADRYLGLAEGLEAAFARSVDLITSASIRNPYFRARVDASRSRVYAK